MNPSPETSSVNNEIDAEGLAHRGLLAAVITGIVGRLDRGVRIVVGDLDDVATHRRARASHRIEPQFDLLVVIDAGRTPDDDLAEAWRAARATLGDGGAAVTLVVSSPVARNLVHHARMTAALDRTLEADATSRDDAYHRARGWAARRAERPFAPPIEPARLSRSIEAADAAGLTLAFGDLAVAAPALARVRGIRSPRARALVATLGLGAAARALVFMPTSRAPKGGLGRAKIDRLATTWVAAAAALDVLPEENALVRAALGVLGEARGDGHPPLRFDALLRQARERWSLTERAAGRRATPSAKDATELALALHGRSGDEALDLYAVDPCAPTWELTNLLAPRSPPP